MMVGSKGHTTNCIYCADAVDLMSLISDRYFVKVSV